MARKKENAKADPKERARRGGAAPGPGAEDEPASFPIAGIGASAGGLEALKDFFEAMPPDSGMAFVVIVHLSPDHRSHLANLLQKSTPMRVLNIEDGQPIQSNTVHVTVPDKEVGILKRRLQLLEPTAPRAMRAPIDYFFRSLAQDQGERAIGIILSGTGSNGTVGLKAIEQEAGMVMVQEPATARYDAMPRSAIRSGLVDYVLPPSEMPGRLIEYVKDFRVKYMRQPPSLTAADANALQKIFAILRNETGHDFSEYKDSTIRRRVARRMAVHRIDRIPNYVRFLTQNRPEVEALFRELLIGVTNFFRDPEVFETLRHKVLPELVKNRAVKQPLRIWVPGCSTGEEAYSIAIVLKEYMNQQGLNFPVQIFATDIDPEAIEAARWGAYPDGIAVDVSPQRLQRFFASEDGRYRVNRDIREMIIFAVQSLAKDPPFSRLDLISCRNVLIYLNESLQQKVLRVFHYSLQKDGFLMLGTSETRGKLEDVFVPVDKKWKIFRRAGEAPDRLRLPELSAGMGGTAAKQEAFARPSRAPTESHKSRDVAERMLLGDYTPAAVLVDENGNALYFHGQTEPFLRPPVGESPFNILPMARESIKVELSTALRRAARQKAAVVYENLRAQHNGGEIRIRLTVRPVFTADGGSWTGWLLVLFEKQPAPSVEDVDGQADQSRLALERELDDTKSRLQATIEELEASNEDVRAANEELQAANEELQSINEELETSQEELQSANEELVTMNADYQNQIGELTAKNNDIHNLLTITEIAILFLDLRLRIKLYTSKAAEIFHLIPSDLGRPLADLESELLYDAQIQDAQAVLDTLQIKSMPVQSRDGKWYRMRVLPYRTVENAVNGVVITFTDITAEREAQQRQINYLESIVGTVREPILVLDPELRIISANRSFYDIFQTTPARTEGEYLYQLDKGQWDIPELRRLLGEIFPERRTIESFEIEHSFPHLGRRTLNLNARRLMQEKDEPDMILLAVQDVTERRRAERKAARERYQYADYVQAAVALTRHPMLILDADLRVLSANPAFLEAFQVEMEDILEHLVYNLNHGAWDLPELHQLLEQRIPQENMVDSYELSGSFPPLGECVLHISARLLLDTGDRPAMIVLAIHNGDAQPSPEE